MEQFTCPSCRNTNPITADQCVHCQADLAPAKASINTANRHYNEALTFARDGRNDDAIRELLTAIELWPENANFHNVLGTCYANKGQYTEAVTSWERTLALDPAYQKAHGNIEKVRKIEDEQKEPKTVTSRGRAWPAYALALLFLAVAIGIGGYAYYQQLQHGQELDRIMAAKDAELEDQSKKTNALQDELDALQQQYSAIQSASDSAQQQIAQLTETIQLSLQERDANWILRSDHDKELQSARETADKSMATLQEQLVQTSKLAEADRKSFQEKVAALDSQIANLQNSASSTVVMSDAAKSEINQLRGQLQIVSKELNILKPRAIELEGKLQAANESSLALRQDYDNLKNVQESNREIFGLASESVTALLGHDYSAAISRCEAILAKDAGNILAQTLLPAIRAMEKEWNDPVNAALREQRAQGASVEIEKIKKSLVEQRLADSRNLLAKGDYDNAILAASQAVEIEPNNSAAIQNLEKIRVAREQHQAALQNVLAEVKSLVDSGALFPARAQVRQVEQTYAYDKPFQSMKEYVEFQAAERDKVLNAEVEKAKVLLLAENFDSSKEIGETVLQENPENEAAKALLSAVAEGKVAAHSRRIAELLRAARESYAQGTLNQANAYIDELLALDPANKEALKIRGDIQKTTTATSRNSS